MKGCQRGGCSGDPLCKLSYKYAVQRAIRRRISVYRKAGKQKVTHHQSTSGASTLPQKDHIAALMDRLYHPLDSVFRLNLKGRRTTNPNRAMEHWVCPGESPVPFTTGRSVNFPLYMYRRDGNTVDPSHSLSNDSRFLPGLTVLFSLHPTGCLDRPTPSYCLSPCHARGSYGRGLERASHRRFIHR